MESRAKGTIIDILKRVAKALNCSGIHYVLVGGLACILYGVQRTTLDIDIIIERSTDEKLRSLIERLREEGFDVLEKDFYLASREDGHVTIVVKEMIRLDIKFASTYLDYASLNNYHVIDLEGVEIKVAGLEENIAAKILVLGDLKDLEDAIILMELYRDSIDWSKLSRYMGSNPLDKIDTLLYRIESIFRDEEPILKKIAELRRKLAELRRSIP